MADSFNDAMMQASDEAVLSGRVVYVYYDNDFYTDEIYSRDYLFKAYPGGRKVISMKGKEFVAQSSDGRQ